MRAFRLVIIATLVTVIIGLAKDREWNTGKVLDAKAAKTYLESGATTSAHTTGTVSPDYGSSSTISANTTAVTKIHQTAVRDTELLIVSDEYTYVVNDTVMK